MRDVFWTILITWLVWKIWSFFSESKRVYIQKNEHHHYHNQQEGKTTVSQNNQIKKKYFSDNEGEYVDFEEVKK